MPETFPVLDPTTGALVDRDHYTLTEVAEMLHMSTTTAYRLFTDERWPHMAIGRRAWMSRDDVAAVVAGLRRNDDLAGEAVHKADGLDLGPVLPPDDPPAESDAADQDPGGIR